MHALFEPPSAPFHKAPSQIYPKISQGPRSGPWICFRNIRNKWWEEKGKKGRKKKEMKEKRETENLLNGRPNFRPHMRTSERVSRRVAR